MLGEKGGLGQAATPSEKKFPLWRFIGPIVVVIAFLWVGPSEILSVVRGADPMLVTVAVLMGIPQAGVRGFRWHVLLKRFDIRLGIRESTAMYAMGMTLATVTPGRIGDFAKIVSLRRKGFRLSTAVVSNIVDRVIDVGFILLVGYGAMWYFSQYFLTELRFLNIAAVAVPVLFVMAVVSRGPISRLVARLVPDAVGKAAKELQAALLRGPLGQKIVDASALAGSTCAAWGLHFLAIWLCALALNLEIPFFYLTACAVLTSLSAFIPITVAGAGTRDAIFLVLLGQLDFSHQQSLALSALVLALFLSNCAVFFLISTALGNPYRGISTTELPEIDNEEIREVHPR